MAVLIIMGTTVVIVTVIHRLYARFNPSPTSPANVAVSAPPAPSVLPHTALPTIKLGAGEHIVSIATVGADLAILVAAKQGEILLILNPASGEIRPILTSP